jgi:integrase
VRLTSVDQPRHRRPTGAPTHAVKIDDGIPSWERTVEAFLRRACYAASTETTARYYLLHGRWSLFMKEQGIVSQADLTADHISAFLDRLKSAGLSTNSLRHYRRLLKDVLSFCQSVPGYATKATLDITKIARLNSGNVVVSWTRDVEVAVVTAASEGRAGRRDSLLVRHMLATGVRSSEARASVLADFRWSHRPPTLEVRRSYRDESLTQSSRNRSATWHPPYTSLPRELAAYVSDGRPQTWRQEMFLSVMRPNTSLSSEAMKEIFQRISERIGYHVHAGQTRHTWAQRLAASGMAPSDLMLAGGWSRLSEVAVYYAANKMGHSST